MGMQYWHINTYNFRWCSFPVFYCLIVLVVLGCNVILSLLNLFQAFAEGLGGNASQLAFSAKIPVFYIMSFLM